MTMKVLAAAKFKERCLALLDDVDPEGIIITKRGKPVAKLMPIERSGRSLLGSMKGRLVLREELDSTGLRWKAGRTVPCMAPSPGWSGSIPPCYRTSACSDLPGTACWCERRDHSTWRPLRRPVFKPGRLVTEARLEERQEGR
jgi:prevent-host-death family protein